MPLNANPRYTEASGDPFTGGVNKLDSDYSGGVVELCRSSTDLLQDRDSAVLSLVTYPSLLQITLIG